MLRLARETNELDRLTTKLLWIRRSGSRHFSPPGNRLSTKSLRRHETGGTPLEPLHQFADTLEAHWEGVLRWHHSRINNGLLEGLNSLIQLAKQSPRVPLDS